MFFPKLGELVTQLECVLCPCATWLWHDDIIKWKHFPRNWPFHRSRWFPRTKASDAELWCFFDLSLNKRLSKQSLGWWFETQSRPLWRHCNEEGLSVRLRVWPIKDFTDSKSFSLYLPVSNYTITKNCPWNYQTTHCLSVIHFCDCSNLIKQ